MTFNFYTPKSKCDLEVFLCEPIYVYLNCTLKVCNINKKNPIENGRTTIPLVGFGATTMKGTIKTNGGKPQFLTVSFY